MSNNNETPERKRERLRQEELKRRNPTGNMGDSFNRAQNGSLVDLVGSLGWKGTGILILVIIIAIVIATIFLK